MMSPCHIELPPRLPFLTISRLRPSRPVGDVGPPAPTSCGGPIRYLVLVDGEHYPPVVESALREMVARGDEVVATLLVGGREKLPPGGISAYGSFDVYSGGDPRVLLDDTLIELRPDAVYDLADEPVLDYRTRLELASISLGRGIPYHGAGFRLDPPPLEPVGKKPSIGIIGTGKRTGKTAVAGFAARSLKADGRRPTIVAMGRGGPEEPVVLRGDEIELTPDHLLAMANEGKHAASDYVEDALLGRSLTVGCRRCGGGLAGNIEFSNVVEGVEVANALPGDILLIEGSGSSLPPVLADVYALVVPAGIPPEYLSGYLGPYRMLLSDLVIVTMCEEPFGSTFHVSELVARIRESFRPGGKGEESQRELRVTRTVFRPYPIRPVEGLRVFVATTAPETAGDSIRLHLEEHHGCTVVGMSHSLSDRERLMREVSDIGRRADVLLCEIKAAGVDVATRVAIEKGLEVVYMDNVPVGIEGDDPAAELLHLATLADKRFEDTRR
jgi:cyclic 2,3-diphosphoglycerate synthase